MKKVAFVLTFGWDTDSIAGLGGAERRLAYIFTGIHSDEVEITVYLQVGSNQDKIWDLISHYCISDGKIIFMHNYWSLFIAIAKGKYDYVCYTDCVVQSAAAILGASLAKSKKVMTIESARRSVGMFVSPAEKFIMSINYRMSSVLDTLYPRSRHLLEEKYKSKKRTVSVTPCTLPRMERYFSKGKENIILFSGRLYSAKNPLLFVKAAIICAQMLREKDFICYICGEGILKEEIKKMVQDARCEDIIQVLGYQNMEHITPKCKVFCSLQNIDNYPSQALLEAITAGCYCICTNEGDTSMIVKPAFGKLIPTSEEALVAEVLNALAFDEAQWENIQESAERFAKMNFDVEQARAYYVNMFTKCEEMV